MQRFMVGLAAALAVAVLPSFAAAQDGKRPDHRPQPEVRSERPNHEGPNARAVFNRLDSNKDGKLSFEEFAVGFRQVSQMMQSRMQGGMKFAHDKMGAFKAEFAKHHGKGHPGMPEFAKKGGPQGKPEFGKFMGFPGPQCPCADKCPGAGCQCGCQMKSNPPFSFFFDDAGCRLFKNRPTLPTRQDCFEQIVRFTISDEYAHANDRIKTLMVTAKQHCVSIEQAT